MKAAGQNLPHQGHPEVDDWVKVFYPIQGAMLGTAGSALGTHQHDAITAGTPAGSNAVSLVKPKYDADLNMVVKPVIALTHNADPVVNLSAAALYIIEASGKSMNNIGRLESTTASNASVLGETANGTVGGVNSSARFYVKDNDSPGGVPIYVNEASSDRLEFVSPTAADAWIVMPLEAAAGAPPGFAVAVKVYHSATAAAGKPLYFDDNGAADAQLAFVDAGGTGGVIPAADIVVMGPAFMKDETSPLGQAAAQAFSGTALGTHQHPAVTAGTPTVALKAVGAGDPPISEVSTFGFSAVQMEAAGDDCRLLIPVPDNMALSQQMKVSVAWSTDSVTTTQTATWKVLFKAIAAGEALAAPTTALDTVIAADAVDDTAYGFQETPQGVINGATFEKGDIIAMLLELDAVSVLNPASDKVYCHGVFIEYIRAQL